MAYFSYAQGRFATRFTVPSNQRQALQELVRELVDWQLAEYLDRAPDGGTKAEGHIVCKVSHAGRRPILFLPDRATNPEIPNGAVQIVVGDDQYEAIFVKAAINVIRKAGSDQNDLPALLRNWFGPTAGLPGTNFSVFFEQEGDRYRLSPVRQTTPEP